MGAQAVISDINRLLESRHAFIDFNIDPSFMLDSIQIILVYDLLWDSCQLYPHVLTVAHWTAIVEVLDVKCAKPGPWYGQCAVR